MTGIEPVWDGTDTDPWLPVRLAADTAITAAEMDVYRAYWSRLSAWLVEVARAVLSGGRPDPVAVFSQAPLWAQLMADFTQGAIRAVIAQAYKVLLGPGFDFDARPAVATHLAQVYNRMVLTPDDVFDLIAVQIAKGAGDGEGIPELSKRVQDVLSTTGTPYWPNRATVVARTETLGALNAGRDDAFRAVATETGEDFERMWLSTMDGRTRPTHRAADGQRQPMGVPFRVGTAMLMFPGQPGGPPEEVIQCRCTTLLVRPGEDVDLSHRQFTDF